MITSKGIFFSSATINARKETPIHPAFLEDKTSNGNNDDNTFIESFTNSIPHSSYNKDFNTDKVSRPFFNSTSKKVIPGFQTFEVSKQCSGSSLKIQAASCKE